MLITAQIDGQQLEHWFCNLEFDAKKLDLFSELVGAQMVHSTAERFNNQKSPSGIPWIQSLRARQQGGETLRDTGRLLNSLTHTILPDGVEWGTNVVYAPVMHYGAQIVPKNKAYLSFLNALGVRVFAKQVVIPARPFLGINEQDKTAIGNIMHQVLED